MHSGRHEVDIRILGGLPVTVSAYVESADPSVGIFEPYVGSYDITYIGNRACKNPPDWLYKRIAKTDLAHENILDAITDELRRQ